MKVKLFTHIDLDGVGCAILVILAFGAENVDIVYCDYADINQKVQEFYKSSERSQYDLIFITDISVKEDTANLIESYNHSDAYQKVTLIDHHPTVEDLNKYDWANVIIKDSLIWLDDEYHDRLHKVSGTYLFCKELDHKYGFKQIYNLGQLQNLFRFVEQVRQYDTWEWTELYNNIKAKQWNDLFFILGRDKFINNVIDKILNSRISFDETDTLLLELEQEKINTYIDEKEKGIIRKTLLLGGNSYNVGMVFAEQYVSQLGNELAKRNADLDFIVLVNPSKTISYRGIRTDLNLGELAKTYYNGGGQPKASGSPMTDEMRNKILNLIFGLEK